MRAPGAPGVGAGTGGRLVLVATPIGNLGDLSPRAVRVLEAADVIACEDTRRARQLLSHAGIPAGGTSKAGVGTGGTSKAGVGTGGTSKAGAGSRLVVVNDHNESAQVGDLLRRLDAGQQVALITDAGTPGISDPGERVVAAAVAAGHVVEVVPGPSAALVALVMSGLPTGRFCFEGFLPRKGAARTERLEELRRERRTTVLFEAPHRVRRTVADLAAALGPDRQVFVARELTKRYEEGWRGTLADAVRHLEEGSPRGEYVVVVAGAPAPAPAGPGDVEQALRDRIEAGLDRRSAIAEVAAALSVPKRSVYEIAVRL